MSAPSAYETPGFRAPIDLDLSRNEGRPGALSLDRLTAGLEETVSRYPDVTPLREALAHRLAVSPDQVLITAGADDALLRCFMSIEGGTAVAAKPTFEMIRRYSEQTGVGLIEVDWPEGTFPLEEFLDAADDGATTAFIVSPNNPTGAVITARDLTALAGRFGTVVYDAAYVEFADADLTRIAQMFPNVISLRTLSKAYGLAGLRIGYAVGDREQIERLAAYGNPYPVSSVSALIATETLASGTSDDFVARVRDEREDLRWLLAALGVDSLPSQANFVLARPRDPGWLVGAAAALGVGLRSFRGQPGLEPFVRIGLPGDPLHFDRLVRTLLTVLSPEAIIFDLDGVVAADAYTRTVLATAGTFGVRVGTEDVWEARGEGNANDDWELTRRLCARAGVDLPYETVREVFEEIYQGTPGAPGLKATETPTVPTGLLEKVASRFPIAIVTGRPRDDAMEFLDRFGLTDLFGAIVTREDAPMKPDPAPVRLALQRLGVTRAWMLGDTVDDLAAARAAGVLPIGVIAPNADPDRARSDLSAAAVVLDTTARIIEVLDAQNV